MSDVTKKQHYVWRNYLVPWTHNQDLKTGKIYVLRKNPKGTQEEIEYQILTKVGFEKFYYDISNFNENDINMYNEFIKYFQRNNRISFVLDTDEIKIANEKRDFIEKVIMSPMENIDNKYSFREKLMNKDVSFYTDSVCRRVSDILKKAIFESIITQEKVLSNEVAAALFLSAMRRIDDEDLKYEFNLFFCMQYCRSPRIHENLTSNFEEFKKNSKELSNLNHKFAVNLIALLFAQKMALNMTFKLNTSMKLYVNNSTIPFITGDTPVVNISDSETTAELYYPISPSIAVIVSNTIIPEENTIMTIDKSQKEIIEIFNAKLYRNCVNEVYSNEEDILKMCKEISK